MGTWFIVKNGGKLAITAAVVVVTKNDLCMWGSGVQSQQLCKTVKAMTPPEVADLGNNLKSGLRSLDPVQIITNSRKEGSFIYSTVQTGKDYMCKLYLNLWNASK